MYWDFFSISGAFENVWWQILLIKFKNTGCFCNIYSLVYSRFYNSTTKLKLGLKTLTKGCPQGSVLGPYLWNIGFDDFFTTLSSLTRYADEGLLLIQVNVSWS